MVRLFAKLVQVAQFDCSLVLDLMRYVQAAG